uniref:WD repeat-containing protein on Y chromosome n=1 Tax=Anabas testudineus TaxID=64144 RepID=A0A7N6FEJ4_ANATE
MQIDTNCDKTVDLGELTDFVLNKNQSLVSLDCKNHPFPKPFIVIPVAHYKAIVSLLFCPIEEELDSDFEIGETRTYQKGHYFSISSDGIFTLWSDSFDTSYTIPLYKTKKTIPYSHEKKMHITDMVYIKELKQVAQLVTGGTDGLLRVWFPHKTVCCQHVLRGHTKPISHIMANHKDKLLISLSRDMNVRVWAEDGWMCRQSFQAYGMERTPISSPLCSNGVVTVWDILTGKAVMQFKVTPEQHVGLTTMSFDGPQRRLITVSDDGKVRLWNFNNGKQLAVLPVGVNTATLLTSADGYICAWSVKSKGGLLAKFKAVNDEYAVITTMSTDVNEQILLMGDSTGRIYLWDIQGFGFKNQADTGPFENIKGWRVSLRSP